MTLTQIGLLIDMVGFVVIAGPALLWNVRGIPFLPKRWEGRWWRYLVGVILILLGFGLQFVGAGWPNLN